MQKVAWSFDHPTFRLKSQTSTDRVSGYSVSCVGWGCLQNVGVAVHFADGEVATQEFDMCRAVGFT